jgi:hypothetical protein
VKLLNIYLVNNLYMAKSSARGDVIYTFIENLFFNASSIHRTIGAGAYIYGGHGNGHTTFSHGTATNIHFAVLEIPSSSMA